MPLDLSHHLTRAIRAQPPSPMKAYGKLVGDRQLLSLAGGMPHPSLFPLRHAAFTLPAFESLTGDIASWRLGTAPKATAHLKATQPGTESDPGGVLDLNEVLQYGLFVGYPQLSAKLVDLNRLLHGETDADIYISGGNTDAINKVFTIFVEQGDTVLAEEFSFTNSLTAARSKGANVVPVKMDEHGIIPQHLDEILTSWDTANGPKPRLLYTIPCGQNPTGAVLPPERYDAVYGLAQKHDLLIIEDDPYFALQYRPYGDTQPKPTLPRPTTPGDDDLEALAAATNTYAGIRSFLSRDVDGRVLRLDTFSKLFGPGLRLGWVAAQPAFVASLIRTGESATQVPCNLSQALLAAYLSDEQWGLGGWLRWSWAIRGEYERKRNIFLAALEKNVSPELVSTTPTRAGMFQWLVVHVEKHPRYRENAEELTDELATKLIDAGVLLMPARLFRVPGSDASLAAFRATFAGDTETIEKALEVFGRTVTAWFEA